MITVACLARSAISVCIRSEPSTSLGFGGTLPAARTRRLFDLRRPLQHLGERCAAREHVAEARAAGQPHGLRDRRPAQVAVDEHDGRARSRRA